MRRLFLLSWLGVASVEADASTRGNADDVSEDSSDPLIGNNDEVDMEPLF